MWTILGVILGVLLIAVWVYALFDVWRRRDLSTAAKVGWTLAIVILPFVGTVIYLIVGFALRDALSD